MHAALLKRGNRQTIAVRNGLTNLVAVETTAGASAMGEEKEGEEATEGEEEEGVEEMVKTGGLGRKD